MDRAKLMAVVVVVAAIVLPGTSYLAGQQHDSFRRLSEHWRELSKQRASLIDYQDKAEQYKDFVDTARRFSEQAQVYGLVESNWSRHDVNIDNRDVGYAELAQFVEQASSNQRQYFAPRYLKLVRQGSAHGTTSSRQSEPPGGMRMSLRGTYLVNMQ